MTADKQRLTFISYSRADKDFALELAKELRSSGFNIWLDQLDIPTGARWDDEVEKALTESDIFMVILTPKSIASNNVKDEIGYAIDGNKRILPVLLENANVPLRLRRFQYVDFTNISYKDGIELSKQLLRKLLAEPPEPKSGSVPEIPRLGQKTGVEYSTGSEINANRSAHQRAESIQKGHGPQTPAPSSKSPRAEVQRQPVPKKFSVFVGIILLIALLAGGVTAWPYIFPQTSATASPTNIMTLTPTVSPSATAELPRVEQVVSDFLVTHLGDEDFPDWEKLHEGCYETAFYVILPLNSLTLSMEVFDTDAENPVTINGVLVAPIPNQNVTYGGDWGAYTFTIPNTSVQQGSNSLEICPAPATLADFSGDLDDFKIRNIVLTIER